MMEQYRVEEVAIGAFFVEVYTPVLEPEELALRRRAVEQALYELFRREGD